MNHKTRSEHGTHAIAAIVLAAGQSTRMGGANKLAAEVHGVPMIAHVVEALERSDLQRIVVVTGYKSEHVRAILQGFELDFVHNLTYAEGMASSIRVGIGALDNDIVGALICLGDMPFVPPEVVDSLLLAALSEKTRSIFVPVFEGRRGNPVLWRSKHFDELLGLTGDVGGRQLFDLYDASICHVEVSSRNILIDLDTAEAFRRAE